MPSAWISWQKCSNAFDLKKLEIKKSSLIPQNIPAHIFGILHTSFSWIKSFLVTWCTYLRSGQLRHSTSPPFNFPNNWCPIRIIPFRLPGSLHNSLYINRRLSYALASIRSRNFSCRSPSGKHKQSFLKPFWRPTAVKILASWIKTLQGTKYES